MWLAVKVIALLFAILDTPTASMAQPGRATADHMTELIDSGWGFTLREGRVVKAEILRGNIDTLANPPLFASEIEAIHTNADRILAVGTASFVSRYPSVRDLTIDQSSSWDKAITIADFRRLLSLPRLHHLRIERLLLSEDLPAESATSADLKLLNLTLGEGVPIGELIRDLRLEELRVVGSDENHLSSTISAMRGNLHLRHLTLSMKHLRGRQWIDLAPLFTLPRLTSLELQNVAIDPQQLNRLRHLKSLHLCNCWFTTSPGDSLFRHPTLEELILELQLMENLQISQRIVDIGERLDRIELCLPSVRDLPLFCDVNCDLSITLGSHAPSLMNCYEARSFGDDHILSIFGTPEANVVSTLRRLKELRLTGGITSGEMRTSEAVISGLVELTSIESLEVNAQSAVSSRGISLPSESSLKHLVLRLDPSPSLRLLSEIAGRGLESLVLDFPELPKSGERMPVLQTLHNLKALELRCLGGGDLTSVLSSSLCSPSLRYLRINEGYIASGEIQKLIATSPNLEEVELLDCTLAEASDLLLLNRLANLNRVSVLDCNTSTDVVLRLKADVIRVGRQSIGGSE